MSRDHYIIDGYNVLHAHPVLGPALSDDLDAARARLVAELAGFAQGGPRTIVVFDGAGNPASDGAPHHLGPLTVIFSKAGVSADTVIEGLARRFRERGERAVVVTSDGATRDTVFSGSVSVLSAAAFVDELAGEAERRSESTTVPRRVPVSERIDANVGATLARWVRGDVSMQKDD